MIIIMNRTILISILLSTILFAGGCSEPEPDPQDVWLSCASEWVSPIDWERYSLFNSWRDREYVGLDTWIINFNIRTKKYQTASTDYHIKHSGKLTVEDTVVGMELEDGTLVIVNRETLTAAIKPPFSINKSEYSFIYSCEIVDEQIGEWRMQRYLERGAERARIKEEARQKDLEEKNKF